MNRFVVIGILACQTSLMVQGTFVYRKGAEVTSAINIDLNLDGTTDFTLSHPVTEIGDELRSSQRVTPFGDSSFAPEIMKSTQLGGGIAWSAGQTILAEPGPDLEWSDSYLNIRFMLVAIRLRNGEDWNYGWMRFEKVGEDLFGDIWGLQDAAYNSIPNAPINILQVPEPSSVFLLALGGLGWVVVGRSRMANPRTTETQY